MGGSKLDAQRHFLTKELAEGKPGKEGQERGLSTGSTDTEADGRAGEFRWTSRAQHSTLFPCFLGQYLHPLLAVPPPFTSTKVPPLNHIPIPQELCSQGCQSLPNSYSPFILGSKTPELFCPHPHPLQLPSQKLSFSNFPVARDGLRTESWPRDATGSATPRHVGSS